MFRQVQLEVGSPALCWLTKRLQYTFFRQKFFLGRRHSSLSRRQRTSVFNKDPWVDQATGHQGVLIDARVQIRLTRRLFEFQPWSMSTGEHGMARRVTAGLLSALRLVLHTSFPQTFLADEVVPEERQRCCEILMTKHFPSFP